VPQIFPFQGLRYNPEQFSKDCSNLIAPPYDVLGPHDKLKLRAGHDQNIVTVDLPHVPPDSAGPDSAYEQAGQTLNQWRREGTLILENQPAVYVYYQDYSFGGQAYTRKMFVARMHLEPCGTGSVFAHEQTFGGPKEDRLKLMQATGCQLSPVFALYSDPDQAVSRLLDVADREPDLSAQMEGVENRMWVVKDDSLIDALCSKMASHPVYLADGHHRYSTALTYRDALGSLPVDHPAQCVVVGFCAMEDPGALIRPTHRVLSQFGDVTPGRIVEMLETGLKMTSTAPTRSDPEKLLTEVAKDDLAIYSAPYDRLCTAQFTNRAVIDHLAPEKSAAWRALDVAYVHRYLIEELVSKKVMGGAQPRIDYFKTAKAAIQAARERHGIALLCRPCTMAQLRAVSQAGDLMPQKTTYFYPKLATGLVLNPLVP